MAAPVSFSRSFGPSFDGVPFARSSCERSLLRRTAAGCFVLLLSLSSPDLADRNEDHAQREEGHRQRPSSVNSEEDTNESKEAPCNPEKIGGGAMVAGPCWLGLRCVLVRHRFRPIAKHQDNLPFVTS